MPKLPGSGFDPRIYQEVQWCVTRGMRPAQIYRHLTGKFPGLKLPRQKTIENWFNDLNVSDESGTWSFANDETGMSGVILDTLRQLIETTNGRINSITTAEAGFITQIYSVAPNLDALMRWFIARWYVANKSREEPTAGLDAYLAYQPWLNAQREASYRRAVDRGWIPPAPEVHHSCRETCCR